ncbi:hypothetical protein OG689_41495 [Kitasatospora sp. NBC_00240]|uniref:hypothetical protein n=1 Tax=Kitasatospora sp. NBC_00240 TaxID=2903567 RepID=UPI00225481B5|nr:hypothetical protein [Kitasatospora sp. NBC_00240]MCX5215632.1 hypothetical protein [Kitasatospora sp. NBC_00240]
MDTPLAFPLNSTLVDLQARLPEATVLGEDIWGWRTALVAAVVAAVLLELTTAIVRTSLLRLPGLLLQLTVRPQLTASTWRHLRGPWSDELAKQLRPGSGRYWRYFGCLKLVGALALGGAAREAAAAGLSLRFTTR